MDSDRGTDDGTGNTVRAEGIGEHAAVGANA
jgi:hypothetical protein